MPEEVTLEEFQQTQLANRHKEITDLLTRLSAVIAGKGNEDIILALQQSFNSQANEIAKFISAIKDIPAPQVTVQSNDNSEKIIEPLRTMIGTISKGQQELRIMFEQILQVQNKKKEWTFTVYKNSIGSIESVKAIQIK